MILWRRSFRLSIWPWLAYAPSMKKLLAVLAVALLGFTSVPQVARCADAKTELQALVDKIKAKLQAGKNSAQDLTDELNGFDTILAAHKDEKTDDVAHVLFMKALLYSQVLEDDTKANEAFAKLKSDYPDTADGKKVDEILAAMAKQQAGKKIQSSLVEGSEFPTFSETGLDAKPFALADYKGKLVLVDFWATWCGPCVGELPNVMKVYEKHHGEGFEILGVSLDGDKERLTSFLKEKNMTWPQYFDGQKWENKLAVKYGVNSIPATYLLGKDGKIIGKGLRGEALENAVTTALAAK